MVRCITVYQVGVEIAVADRHSSPRHRGFSCVGPAGTPQIVTLVIKPVLIGPDRHRNVLPPAGPVCIRTVEPDLKLGGCEASRVSGTRCLYHTSDTRLVGASLNTAAWVIGMIMYTQAFTYGTQGHPHTRKAHAHVHARMYTQATRAHTHTHRGRDQKRIDLVILSE